MPLRYDSVADSLDLSGLFEELRNEGLPVGLLELERLRAALRAVVGEDDESSTQSSLEEQRIDEARVCRVVDRVRLEKFARLVTVKTDADARAFHRAFGRWIQRAGQEVERLAEPAPPKVTEVEKVFERALPPKRRVEVRQDQQQRARRLRSWGWVGGAAAGLVVVLSIASWMGRSEGNGTGSTRRETGGGGSGGTTTTEPRQQPSRPAEARPGPVETVRRPVLELISVTPRGSFPTPGWWLLLAALSGGLAAGSWWRFRRRAKDLPRVPVKDSAGREYRVRPPRSVARGIDFVAPDATRELIWGVEKIRAEDPGLRYDLRRTVEATVRAAGLPSLVRERPKQDRVLWLWLDRSTQDFVSVRAFATEITTRLTSAGVPVRCVTFDKSPRILEPGDGTEPFSPYDLESAREGAVVAVLTDGRGLATLDADATERGSLGDLLRALCHWRRLTFVDFPSAPATQASAQGAAPRRHRDFARLLSRHGLRCITPDVLPAFVADSADRDLEGRVGSRLDPARERVAAAELQFLAAALALLERPFDLAEARGMVAALGLRGLQALDVERLATLDGLDRGGLTCRWSRERRLELLDWFAVAEDHRAGARFAPRSESFLQRAVEAWRQRIADEARLLGERSDGGGDAAFEALRIQDACVQVLTDPAAAAAACQELADGGAKRAAAIRSLLGDFVPWRAQDCADHARLAWERDDIDPEVLQQLLILGLGHREQRPGVVVWPRAFVAAVAALCVVALGALVAGFGGLGEPVGPPQTLMLQSGQPLHSHVGWSLDPSGLVAVTPQWTLRTPAEGVDVLAGTAMDSVTRLAWRHESENNPERGDGVAIWRAGYRDTPPRPVLEDWPLRSVAWIDAAPTVEGALLGEWENWAVTMLDAGVFDVVVVGESGEIGLSAALTELLVLPEELADGLLETQLVALTTREPRGLGSSRAMRAAWATRGDPADYPLPPAGIAEPMPAESWWPGMASIDRLPMPLLARGVGLDMVKIPSGRMPDEEQAGNWLLAFQISRFEVTRGDWLGLGLPPPVPLFWSESDDEGLPANGVSWFDALRFCNALSVREGLVPRYYQDREFQEPLGPNAEQEKPSARSGVRIRPDANGYRLPSELEHEYATRAGALTRFFWGGDASQADRFAWFGSESTDDVHPVGQKAPNAWGLYDVVGNVAEWCEGSGSESAELRVLHGGSFKSPSEDLSSDLFSRNPATSRYVTIGFRVARSTTLLDMVPVTGGEMPGGDRAGERVESFEISRYEVTRGAWRALGLEVPEPDSWREENDDDLPANYLNWFDAVQFCNALSAREGLVPRYYEDAEFTKPWSRRIDSEEKPGETAIFMNDGADGYRLPSELEWEFACRAETATKFHWGEDEAKAEDYAWFDKEWDHGVRPVGMKRPNPWGLQDITGNVWEWCEDWYDQDLGGRALRGGSFLVPAADLASSRRRWYGPSYRDLYFGFRVVRGSLPQHGAGR